MNVQLFVAEENTASVAARNVYHDRKKSENYFYYFTHQQIGTSLTNELFGSCLAQTFVKFDIYRLLALLDSEINKDNKVHSVIENPGGHCKWRIKEKVFCLKRYWLEAGPVPNPAISIDLMCHHVQ